jgi:hypothetical protein
MGGAKSTWNKALVYFGFKVAFLLGYPVSRTTHRNTTVRLRRSKCYNTNSQ